MKLHANARLSPNGRRLLVDRLETDGWDISDAAAAAGISVRTAYKWLARWRGLSDEVCVVVVSDRGVVLPCLPESLSP
jgi:hypothetical protein